jgi:hypothetical protein
MSELLEWRERLESAQADARRNDGIDYQERLFGSRTPTARCRQAHGGSDRGYGRDRRAIRFMDMICRS